MTNRFVKNDFEVVFRIVLPREQYFIRVSNPSFLLADNSSIVDNSSLADNSSLVDLAPEKTKCYNIVIFYCIS